MTFLPLPQRRRLPDRTRRDRGQRPVRPVVLALEERLLLTTTPNVFAVLDGAVAGIGRSAVVPFVVSPSDFTLPRRRLVLELSTSEAAGTPGPLQVVAGGQGRLPVTQLQESGVTLALVGAGKYSVVSASGRGAGAFQVDVSLVGDINGDFRVGSSDLSFIRSLWGTHRGRPAYLVAADANHDGVIGPKDSRLAARNLGVTTQLRPLSVTFGLDPQGGSGDAVVYSPVATLAGQTAPGAQVQLISSGHLVETRSADAGGSFKLATNVDVGASPLLVVASDRFGQHAVAGLTVSRFVDSQGPTVTIQAPSTGQTIHDDTPFAGQATDALSGVATVQERMDNGPWVTEAFDSSGNFRVPINLPLDGSADGSHTLYVQATDHAGNSTDFSESFTLVSPSVNQAVTTDPGVQQMPSIAIDPSDSHHLVIAYMDRSLVTTGYAGIGVGVSHDNGATWQYTSVPLPAGFDQGAANPIVKFDGQGHVFVSFMAATFKGPLAPITNPSFDQRGVPGTQSNNGIFVSRSDDGGLTWNTPAAVVAHTYSGQPVDFETTPDLAIDTFRTLPDGSVNPRYGAMYVTWTRIYAVGQFPGQPDSDGGTDGFLAVSKDGGQTWQVQTQTLPDSGLVVTSLWDPSNESGLGNGLGFGFLDQSHVTIGPQGDVYVSNFGGGDFVVQHSTDGGQTFTIPDHDTGQGIAFPVGFLTFVDDGGLPTNHFRTNAVRDIVADPSRPGTIYATDTINVLDALGNTIDPADVLFARSTDYGQTWQTTFTVGPYTSQVLNDDNQGAMATGSPNDVTSGQALPHMAVDAQGNIAIIWYDTRRDAANHLIDVFGTVSTDGGKTFSPNFRVSDQSFDANAGSFTDATGQTDYYLGDFLGLAIDNGTAYASWTDTLNGNQDVEFTRFPISPAPAAPNDRFEPNNTAQSATDLGLITTEHLPKLALPEGDDDWFRITAASTGNLTITETPADLSLHLSVELWDASGTTRLATASAVTGLGGQTLVYAGQSETSYLVHVSIAQSPPGIISNPSSTQYALDISSLTADLGALVEHVQNGSLNQGDQAFYRLTAGASGSLELTLTPGAGFTGGVNLQVLDATNRNVLATGAPGPGGVITANLAVQQGQALLVGVSGDSPSAGGGYQLAFTNLDQFATPNSASLVFPAGAGPSTVATADLNGDGKLDMVVANALTNTISVLLGNGDGIFQTPRQFAIGAFKSPIGFASVLGLPNFRRQVVIADFNGDHIPDVAVSNFDSGDVSILLGRGDGTFAPQLRFNATAAPFGLAVGDFNGDGIPDLAAIDSPSGLQDSTVAVLLGRGDGTFLPEQTFAGLTGGASPFSTVTVADLNHDGKDDLIVSGSNDFKFSVFLGNGDGTFQNSGVFGGSRFGSGVAVLDLNGDGNLDVVTTGGDHNTVAVNFGNGDGTFGAPTIYPAGRQPVGVVVADLGSQVTLADGSTTFGPPDGHPDLVLANGGNETSSGAAVGATGVFVLPGLVDDQGNFAGFGSPVELAPGQAPQSLALGDFTGDGAMDIAFVDRDGVHVIYNKPPAIPLNDEPATARDLGTVVHVIEPTETIVPGHLDAYFTLTVPTEAAQGAGNEVIDFSGLFQASEGAGLAMEVLDAEGNVLGSGERFRVSAAQGQVLTLHVFAATASDGTRGAGAYTLDIDVLPQIVSAESQALLPGQGGLPGGPTTSIVVTLQGDRLDPATAENPANYNILWLGPDETLGTADDQVIPLLTGEQAVLYDPSANLDVASGQVLPTAQQQTVTLLFPTPLPAGKYQVTLGPGIQSAPFSVGEADLLAGGLAFAGHPVVALNQGNVTNGAQVTTDDLVLPTSALGDLNSLKAGSRFLTQLHDDLGALLDSALSTAGDQPGITPELIDEVINRFGPALGAVGSRQASATVLWLDPVSINVLDPDGGGLDYSLGTDSLVDTTGNLYINVSGNIEIIVVLSPPVSTAPILLTVADVPPTARGGAVILGPDGSQSLSLTGDLRTGVTQFTIPGP